MGTFVLAGLPKQIEDVVEGPNEQSRFEKQEQYQNTEHADNNPKCTVRGHPHA
jgi:hypothetical protein